MTDRRCREHPSRPAPHGGVRTPRCATCERARKTAARQASRERRVQQTYGLTPEQYDAIYEAQGGVCAICTRAKGTGRKRLSVDHDHSCCNGPISCGRCVRGLLCTPCNKLLGHLRDEIAAFHRSANYLEDPPARKVLANDGTSRNGAGDGTEAEGPEVPEAQPG